MKIKINCCVLCHTSAHHCPFPLLREIALAGSEGFMETVGLFPQNREQGIGDFLPVELRFFSLKEIICHGFYLSSYIQHHSLICKYESLVAHIVTL